MAHGGIAYLNKNGFSSQREAVKMYAFVSGTFDKSGRSKSLLLGPSCGALTEEAPRASKAGADFGSPDAVGCGHKTTPRATQ